MMLPALPGRDMSRILRLNGDAITRHEKAKREERECTCGAGHGSLEGHMAWCDWQEQRKSK